MKRSVTIGKAIICWAIALLFMQGCKKDRIEMPVENAKVELSDDATLMNHTSYASAVRVTTLVRDIPLGWIAANRSNGNLYFTTGNAVFKITQSGTVSTLAGSITESGFRNGTGTAARFSGIMRITVTKDGNIYVAEARNHVIRKITPSGVVTTYAGTGTAGYRNGYRLNAQFNEPEQLTSSPFDNSLYVFDDGNSRIRKIYPNGYTRTVTGTGVPGVQDGRVSQATVDEVTGMVIDKDTSLVFVEHNEGRLRRINNGFVKTIVGPRDSEGLAVFALPQGLTIASNGDMFIADAEENRIRRITRTSSGYKVITIAGENSPGEYGFVDGNGLQAHFYYPNGITWYNNRLFVSEQNRAIRKITLP